MLAHLAAVSGNALRRGNLFWLLTPVTYFGNYARLAREISTSLFSQVLMAIDDSESMADCGAGALALAAMTTVASGLTQLEAGQLAVAR